MRGMKDKMIAGAGTIGFMALVTTNSNPKMWQVALIALLLYEISLMAVRIARKQARKARRRRYITISRINAKRWADTKIGWPMREVI